MDTLIVDVVVTEEKLEIKLGEQLVVSCDLSSDGNFEPIKAGDIELEGIIYAYLQPCVTIGVNAPANLPVKMVINTARDFHFIVATLGDDNKYNEPVVNKLVRSSDGEDQSFDIK